MSEFFRETCKILGVNKFHTSSFHPSSNGMVEMWHRSLNTGLSLYVDATHTNWDEVTPFFLMAYRATPNTTTGYSQYYLLHGREMALPNSENLKAKLSVDNPERQQQLSNPKRQFAKVL
jgi:hypothetical protein